MGHFTVRRYAAAFDDASYQLLFRLSGTSPVSQADGLGWADVRQVYEYHAEMLPGTMFSISGAPVRLGTKSIDVEYRMVRTQDGSAVATMRSTLVRLDLKAREGVAVEAAMRARIGQMIDASTSVTGGEGA
ncbi:acyl-CoA thioesterase [Alteraurantiacibacter aestuarii]|uniref:Acyl-CoA thioesterase n=2 Tax=Alteraurantiacibacter aestuarii TaxID=650004 RepID=A0A844ZKN3_9SPHN|nr:acyl-CoA thioesterase [Alteraurantiacibacter aestuarii]